MDDSMGRDIFMIVDKQKARMFIVVVSGALQCSPLRTYDIQHHIQVCSTINSFVIIAVDMVDVAAVE